MVSPRHTPAGLWQNPVLPIALMWVAGSVALGLIGPFGTFETLSRAMRLLFWGGVLAAALTVVGAVSVLVRLVFPGRRVLGLMVQGALITFILGPMIWALCHAVPWGDPAAVPGLGKFILVVFAVWFCISALQGQFGPVPMLSEAQPQPRPAPVGGDGPSLAADAGAILRRPAFLERSDLHLPGAVMRVSADDHYLIIQTDQGMGRIIMRFRDALPDLEALPGFRIHRSHWVAAHAVLRLRLEGRRHVMDLCDGTSLPVSQAYLAPLQAAGLIDQRGMGNLTGAAPTRMASAPWPINAESSGRSQKSPPV